MKLFILKRQNLELKTVLYYLVAQTGLLLFLCAGNSFQNEIRLLNDLKFGAHPGPFNSHSGDLIGRAGIAMLCLGLVQLTRSFLNTTKTLPQLDVRLALGLAGYLVFSLILSLTNTRFFYPDLNILTYENIFLFLLVLVVVCTLITGYMQNLPAAGFFILAILLPILLVSASWWVPVIFNKEATDLMHAYPAILAQALGFPVALVARSQLIKNKLNLKEETRTFEFKRWKTEFGYRVGELENN
jgi:hypothetical protein